MKQEIFIGIFVAVLVALIIGVKAWLHNLLRFKMDESAILKFFKESSGSHNFRSTEAIAAGTDIDPIRVARVCSRSEAIKRLSKEKEFWCSK